MSTSGPYHIPDATNVFALIYWGSQVWKVSTSAYVTAGTPFGSDTELNNCKISLDQPGSLDLWTMDIPSALTDTYQHRVILYNQAGGSPVLSDLDTPLHQFTLAVTPTALVGGDPIGPFLIDTGSSAFALAVASSAAANAVYRTDLDDGSSYTFLNSMTLDSEVVNCAISLNEIGSTGVFFGVLPANLPEGNWVIVAYEGAKTIANMAEGRYQFYTDPNAAPWEPDDDGAELPDIPNTPCLLEAINKMISVIGEAPLTTLTPTTNEIDFAYAILNETDKEVQSHGWTFNTDHITLTPDPGTLYIEAPADLLSLDPLDTSLKTSILNDRLYNNRTRSYEWDKPIKCEFIRLVPFCSLPYWAKHYITVRAARKFQSRTASSEVLHSYTLEDERDAYLLFLDRDGDEADDCIFDNFHHPRPY